MKDTKFKLHALNEGMRLAIILILVLFGGFLVVAKSDLARDITLLIIGVIGGRYVRA